VPTRRDSPLVTGEPHLFGPDPTRSPSSGFWPFPKVAHGFHPCPVVNCWSERNSIHIHPVSALPSYFALPDHLLERELLPRFREARSLRQASAARKIGALRGSVIAALETSLQLGKREALPASDEKESEARLRLISGAIGEQRTHLDHAYL
jgi:hypothetical protein